MDREGMGKCTLPYIIQEIVVQDKSLMRTRMQAYKQLDLYSKRSDLVNDFKCDLSDMYTPD